MSTESEISRRNFLKNSAKTGAGLAALSGITFITHPERVFGANDRVQVGVCGLRGMGWGHVQAYGAMKDAAVAAVCEVDENVLNQRLAEMDKMGLPKPKTFIDVRKLMDDKSIDAVSIATPNHWHSLIGIWACQAGKDVYVEKPCSHNWWEGRQLVRAANKYNRIVQHGTQSRSGVAVIEAVQKMREGLIGEIYLSRGLCFKVRDTIGKTPHAPVPVGVHYDLWTGPAPLKPFTKNRFHYNWHWIWDTGNGDLGNQGIHELDVARWGLGVDFPVKASAIGGHFMFDDDQQTPNTLNCAYEFETPDGKRKMLEFEVRHWITHHEAEIGSGYKSEGVPPAGLNAPPSKIARSAGNTIGNIFYGSKGYVGIEGYSAYKSWLGDNQEPGPEGNGGGNNWANFIQVVQSRKKEDLHAPIEEGHKSATLIHLANASYRLGRTIQFDPKTEKAVNDDQANRLLRDGDRGYRAPYVVPEKV
ncbi:MAG TPA: Gfo/Idh/MocA family oxidoreductase [Terriglobia bacterium]|nr:Gfo/Idh/MocA family oxidoreductase [Terriglobia bacterium]